MSRPRSKIGLKLYRYTKNPHYERLMADRTLERLRDIDRVYREKGLAGLNPKSDALIPIGAEIDADGAVSKNGYGVLHLPWRAQHHPEWPGEIADEVKQIKAAIRQAHGVTVRYIIWAGMGGSAEDKAFYLSAGLVRRRVRVFLLDSTDPRKLTAILDEIVRLEKQPLDKALKKCLVVGMAMGMTSYEPVVNLEKLDALYKKLRIANEANFIYMTLPGSILDEFGRARGFKRVPLQPDGANTTAGRHSGPLTRGSLYPLAFNGVDLAAWMKQTALTEREIRAALQLAGFIQGNAEAGRDKVTLYLPSRWSGGAVWTKQDFEESLGKSEQIGVKIVIGEKAKLVDYFPPKSPKQDRCFLFVNASHGGKNPDERKLQALRRAGYSAAVLDVQGELALARYMQFIHWTVFGLGALRKMNFVTQPGVELYKDYAKKINDRAKVQGDVEKTRAWRELMESRFRLRWRGGISLDFGALKEVGLLRDEDLEIEHGNAAAVYAHVLERLRDAGEISYGELTFFGDTRYDPAGVDLLKALDAAAASVMRSRLKMPADVYEGPAMNHSYHEMIIGFGQGFSTVLLSEKQATYKRVGYTSDYHRAQWLATRRALADRKRAVVAMTIRDTSERSRDALREFFAETARRLRRRR